MAADFQEIICGVGLGDLKFGMHKDDVRKLLGEPDDIEIDMDAEEEDEDDVEGIESWHYDEIGLSMAFGQEDDWRMISIAVSDENYTLNGTQIIGLERLNFLQKVKAMDLGELEFEDWSEDETHDHQVVSALEKGINFWLDEGTVSEIQWGPLFLDEDTIDWPK